MEDLENLQNIYVEAEPDKYKISNKISNKHKITDFSHYVLGKIIGYVSNRVYDFYNITSVSEKIMEASMYFNNDIWDSVGETEIHLFVHGTMDGAPKKRDHTYISEAIRYIISRNPHKFIKHPVFVKIIISSIVRGDINTIKYFNEKNYIDPNMYLRRMHILEHANVQHSYVVRDYLIEKGANAEYTGFHSEVMRRMTPRLTGLSYDRSHLVYGHPRELIRNKGRPYRRWVQWERDYISDKLSNEEKYAELTKP